MFACLFLPDFPVQAAVRVEPENDREKLKQSPMAILDGPAATPRVMSENRAARRAGIENGMTKLQAEACGGIVLRKRMAANESSAQAALLDCAYGFSPRVESTGPGTVIVDLTGTGKLFGTIAGTADKMAAQLNRFGFDAHLAVAADPDSAFYAACGFAGITIIPAGEQARRLASLPVEVFACSPEMLAVLEAWGIRNLGMLAALPEVALVERLGQQGRYLQRLARGEVCRPLVPAELSQEFVESFEFEDPVETLESLTFILNRLLQQVCNRLAARALATNELRLRLELEARQLSGGQRTEEYYARAWKLPVPMQDSKVLFRLVYLDLEANTQSAPVRKIVVEALPVKPRFAQGGLFAPASPEAEQLEITLARIRGVTGSADENGIACVGSPQVLDSHRPDSFTVVPFSSAAAETEEEPAAEAAPRMAMRMFRPPWPAAVETFDDKPAVVSLRKKRLRVMAAYGPWRASGNWWNESSAYARDEWDVALKTTEGPGYYRIYLDRIRGQWFVEGKMD